VFAESAGGRADAQRTIILLLTTPQDNDVGLKKTLLDLYKDKRYAQYYKLFTLREEISSSQNVPKAW